MNTNLHLQTVKAIPKPTYAPCVFEGAFGSVELRRLKKQVENLPEEEALTHGDSTFGSADEDSERIAKQRGIPQVEDFAWLYSKFESLCMQANFNSNWNFEMTGMFEPAIYLTYDGKVKGKYDYHVDVGGDGPMGYRKISGVLLVNDGYEGGELEIETPWGVLSEKPMKGEMVIYNNVYKHRVKPVTKGTRVVIRGWFEVLTSDEELLIARKTVK